MRLRVYDGHYQVAFSWYQDPELVYEADGKKGKVISEKIKKMYEVLSHRGELYFIEVARRSLVANWRCNFSENDLLYCYRSGDLSFIGTGRVIGTLIERARSLSGFRYL